MAMDQTDRHWPLLQKHAPDDLVACAGGSLFTARDLHWSVKTLAADLPASTQGAEALVLCADRYAFLVGLLASWRRGYSVALPPNAQPATLRELISGERVRLLLHDGNAKAGIDVSAAVGRAPLEALAAEGAWTLPADLQLATLYTSGSSGDRRPHGKTVRQLLGEAEVLGRLLAFTPSDRVLATVPPQHIYGLLLGILVPLAHGAAIACGTPLQAEEIAARVRDTGATVLASVPAHLRALSSLGTRDLPGVRLIVSSSAPLEREVSRQLQRFPTRTVELFGSTETGGIAWRESLDEWWHPLPGLSVRAAPDGRLLLNSPLLDPRLPAPFVGADRIEVGDSLGFRHLGRADGVIKIAGKRVSTAEVEERLRAMEGISDAAATSVPAPGGRGREIWAVFVAPSLDVADVRRNLRAWFDPVVLPRRLRRVEQIPREATGKLPLRAWRRLFATGAESSHDAQSMFEVTGRTSHDEEEEERRSVSLKIPVDLSYFKGHFDGFPILSGAVILEKIVIAESRRAWPDLPGLRSLSRLKFRRPILPGDAITLNLVRRPHEPCIDFEIASNGTICNMGTLNFGMRP